MAAVTLERPHGPAFSVDTSSHGPALRRAAGPRSPRLRLAQVRRGGAVDEGRQEEGAGHPLRLHRLSHQPGTYSFSLSDKASLYG
jgi:hypothetical protein